MTDRPILFSGPMIRALLDGRKTQTRRVLKPQPLADGYYDGQIDCTFVPARDAHDCACVRFGASAVGGGAIRTEIYQPPYTPGHRLWVREAWRAMDGQDGYSGAKIAAQCVEAGYRTPWSPLHYEADGAQANWIADPHTFGTKPGRYRHARFMPRWASRLTLTVTDVRVQRLWDISEADAKAEGVPPPPEGIQPETAHYDSYTDVFADLWDSLNADRAPWDSNPWVCAVSFTVAKRNIDQAEAAA